MKKRRPKRKATKPPAARDGRRSGSLQYKVIEVSAVDEVSLEGTLNEWARRGWKLDGIQFAMRESSRRPSMAFVLFTREGAEAPPREVGEARVQLARLAAAPSEGAPAPVSAYDRLAQLASDDEEDE